MPYGAQVEVIPSYREYAKLGVNPRGGDPSHISRQLANFSRLEKLKLMVSRPTAVPEGLVQCIRRPTELPGIVLIHEPGDLEIVVAAQGFQLLGHPPAAVLWVVLV